MWFCQSVKYMVISIPNLDYAEAALMNQFEVQLLSLRFSNREAWTKRLGTESIGICQTLTVSGLNPSSIIREATRHSQEDTPSAFDTSFLQAT
jgi:hypothetical protein